MNNLLEKINNKYTFVDINDDISDNGYVLLSNTGDIVRGKTTTLASKIYTNFKKDCDKVVVAMKVVNPTYTSDSLRKKLNINIKDNFKEVKNVGFYPVDKLYFEDNDRNLYLNTYRHSYFMKHHKINKDSSKEDFPMIHAIATNVCGNVERQTDFLYKRFSWITINPDDRIVGSIIFKGEQGAGKGLLFDKILKHIFNNLCTVINGDYISGSFTQVQENKLIILLDEAKIKQEKDLAKLKNLIGSETILINKKGVQEYTTDNYINYFIATNDDMPVILDSTDRRYTVFENKVLVLNGLSKWLSKKDTKAFELECAHFYSYLLNLEVTRDEIDKPFDNLARRQLLENSKDEITQFIDYCKTYDLKGDILTNYIDKSLTFISNKELYNIYKEWSGESLSQRKFNQDLSFKGFKYETKTIKGHTTTQYRKVSDLFK